MSTVAVENLPALTQLIPDSEIGFLRIPNFVHHWPQLPGDMCIQHGCRRSTVRQSKKSDRVRDNEWPAGDQPSAC
jgi:hypothetical protein